MLTTIKRLVTKFFVPSKYGSRIKIFFNREKVSRTGKSSKTIFGVEFERGDQQTPIDKGEKSDK
jgi:hypothetical protein